MTRTIVTTVIGGALALALLVGAMLAHPTLASQSAGVAAQPTAAPTTPSSPSRPRQQRREQRQEQRQEQMVAMLLTKAAADISGITPADVRQGLLDGKSLAQIAQEHGKTADAVVQAARTTLQDRLKQAVSNGRITQTRADEQLKAFDTQAAQLIGDTTLGQQLGQRFMGRHPRAGALVQATAQITGLTEQQVLDGLRAGKSLAQIAQEHGKTADDILAQMRTTAQERMDRQLDQARELINRPGLGGAQK